MSARLGALLALGGAVVGCGAEGTVPEQPTWVEHVKPILQANCFHCHGAAADGIRQANPGLVIYRWDVFNLKDPRYAMMGFKEVTDAANTKTFVSANDRGHYRFIDFFSNAQADEVTRMPPPPALRLTARELAVLERWSRLDFPLGVRPVNARPAIAWLQPGQTFAVTDADGDQVLGKLDCGGTEVRMGSSGSHSLPPGTAPPCSGMLFDGFDLVSVDLQ